MTASRSTRRAMVGSVLAALVVGVGPSTVPAAALEPNGSTSRLERPVLDLATLPPAVTGGPPRLLLLDAASDRLDAVHLEVVERDREWTAIASADIVLGPDWLRAQWLVGLDATRFALIATGDAVPAGVDASVIIVVRVTEVGGVPKIVEIARATAPDRPISEAGAADVDGDGSLELIVRYRPAADDRRCDDLGLSVLDGMTLATIATPEVDGRRLAGGVIGRWDDVPGDDLLAYAYTTCPSASTPRDQIRLVAVRLSDGTVIQDLEVDTRPGIPRWLGVPLRVDLDGVAPDEAVARTMGGLSLLDPSDGWAAHELGSQRAVGLAAGATGTVGSPVARAAWIEVAGNRSVSTATLARDAAGDIVIGPVSGVHDPGPGEVRWRLISAAAIDAADRATPAVGWLGEALTPGCIDLILTAAILPCGVDELAPGAAWVSARPVAVLPVNGQRRLLIASGVGWPSGVGVPETPTPWAGGPAGWWRRGPSTPFVLSEVRAGDAAYFREFPLPRASIDDATAADASTALPGFTGARLFVTARALPEGEPPAASAPDAFRALTDPIDRSGVPIVARIPVPAGLESGRDGSFTPVQLAGVTLPDGSRPDRWSLTIVPINDWGEVGRPAVGALGRDERPPTLLVEAPFLSPVWPATATLAGVADPGSEVRVDGSEPLELDRRGRFSFEATLAPWPQTLSLRATDASGNVTVRDLSVVGGVDYRQFPWALIAALALLALVAVRGLRSTGGRRAATVAAAPRWGSAVDDGQGPVIEELPPGGGLARR